MTIEVLSPSARERIAAIEPIIDPDTGLKIWAHAGLEDQALLLVGMLADDVLPKADALVRELELHSSASGKKHLQLQTIEYYSAQVFYALKAICEAIEEHPQQELHGVRRELHRAGLLPAPKRATAWMEPDDA
jgi:hypothetical protein